MLLIRCSACRRKLWRYDKIGSGTVLRCHKVRILKVYEPTRSEGDRVVCPCGQWIGIDKGPFIRMARRGFTSSGTKTGR